jgi:peptidyl-prolyl cis-trans isomerase SurA
VKLLILFLFFCLPTLQAEEILIDKIAAIVNSKVISLSEVTRIQETIDARKEISPLIYNQKSFTQNELIKILIKTFIIRDKISSQGYVINDEAVESRIKMTEERLGLKRSDLLQFLRSKKISFEEYFEIIRETMEFNIFSSRIIAPLISITDQEIKNEYFKQNSKNKTLSFRYNLVDFYIKNSNLKNFSNQQFLQAIRDFQLTGKLPLEFSSLETNPIEGINEDSLSKELSTVLKSTIEGGFSAPITINDYLHIFYVQKKDLTESQDFQKAKDKILNELMSRKSEFVTNNWFEREFTNYYIKIII